MDVALTAACDSAAILSSWLHACRFGPMGILLDDLHHFDVASWQFLHALRDDLGDDCFVVATFRENEGTLEQSAVDSSNDIDKAHINKEACDVLEKLADMPSCTEMKLEQFSAAEVRAMMLGSLPGYALHESNVCAILRQTEGNPAHIEQVLYCLDARPRDALEAALRTEGGLESDSSVSSELADLKDVVLARFDKLSPDTNLTLKVCSVLGNRVQLEVLLRAHPQRNKAPVRTPEQQRKQVLEDLNDLVGEMILEPVEGRSCTWEWQSHIARDMLYRTMAVGVSKQFHANAAAALAQVPDTGLPLSHIAWHWSMSCKEEETVQTRYTRNAIQCWKSAAHDVAAKGAYFDAVRFMTRAMELSEKLTAYEVRQLQRREGISAQEALPAVSASILDIAQQHKFRADMYFKLLIAVDPVRS